MGIKISDGSRGGASGYPCLGCHNYGDDKGGSS